MDRWLEVRGKVQNVMFRQTVIRAMQKRGLRAAPPTTARTGTWCG